jgi:hypothetical protein
MNKKALIIEIFTSIALSEFKTELSMATPCSVKAKGAYYVPPLLFEVLKLLLKDSHSVLVNSNIKSGGNLLMFALTALLRYFVSDS